MHAIRWQFKLLHPFPQVTSRRLLNKPAETISRTESTPVLGQAVGAYRERPVPPHLRQHFACVWFHSVPQDAPVQSAIVPDGCADLLWFNRTLRVAGPDRQAKIECAPPGMTVVGLRFQPGAALRWLDTPVSDVVDARVSLECFWGAEARRLAEWVGEAQTPEGVARRLETELTHRLPHIAPPDGTAAAIFRIVSGRHNYSIPLAHQIEDALGLGERTLRRRCHEAFGYGPKTLDRILRFQRFLQLARTPGFGGTADLAADAGYSDQSHLTRETRHLTGLTPNMIREQFTS
jgi:AraC-like DNA-binding protein